MASRIIEKSYLFFLLLLPFVYFSFVVDPALVPRQVYLSIYVLSLLTVLAFVKIDLASLPLRNPLYLAIAGYTIVTLLPFLHANFTAESHLVFSRQCILFVFLLLTIHLLNNKTVRQEQLIPACMGFGLIAICSAYYDLFHHIDSTQKFLQRIRLVTGLFANKNLLSSILFLCLPFFCMGLFASKKIRNLAVFGILTMLPVLLLIRSRAVLIGLLLYVSVVGLYFLKIRFGIQKKKLLIGCAVFFISGIGILKVLYQNIPKQFVGNETTFQKYLMLFSSPKTLMDRFEFWENAMAMWQEYPFGVGLGNWPVYFPKYGLDKLNDFMISNGIQTLQRPHNDFLNVLGESGFLGLIAYCFLLGVVIYQLWFLLKHSKSMTEKWNLIFILAGIIGYMAISFFDFPMERIEHQIFLMLLFAITTVQYHSHKKTAIKTVKKSKLYLPFAMGLYSLLVSTLCFKGEVETLKMYVAKAQYRWGETLYFANRAENYFYKTDRTSIPIDFYKGMAAFNTGNLTKSVEYFESAYQKAPYQVQVINNLATAYARSGNIDKAIEYYEETLRVSSRYEDARLNLTAMYYNRKRFHEAFLTIDKMDIDTHHKSYKKYLLLVLSKEINLILIKNNDAEFSRKIAQKIYKGQHLYALYETAKRQQIPFEDFVLKQ